MRINLLLEVVLLFVDKLDSTLQKESLGWGSPAPDRHRGCHRREQIPSHTRRFGMALVSRRPCQHKPAQGGYIL